MRNTPPYLWPARSASHLTEKENQPRATGARTSSKKKSAPPLARAERKPFDRKRKLPRATSARTCLKKTKPNCKRALPAPPARETAIYLFDSCYF